ncbi:hypothetical protein QP597_11140 [Providencia stuartii]|nr:hypothetical protein [Providencia stuartii]
MHINFSKPICYFQSKAALAFAGIEGKQKQATLSTGIINIKNTVVGLFQEPKKAFKQVKWSKQLATVIQLPPNQPLASKGALSIPMPPPMPKPDIKPAQTGDGGKTGMDQVIAELKNSPVFKANAQKYQAAATEQPTSTNTPPPPPPMAEFAGLRNNIAASSQTTHGKTGMDQVIAELKNSPVFKANAQKYQAAATEQPTSTNTPPPPMAEFAGLRNNIAASSQTAHDKTGMDQVIAELKNSPIFKANAQKYQAAATEQPTSTNTPPPPPPMAKFAGLRNTIATSSQTTHGKTGMDQVIAQLKQHPVFKSNKEQWIFACCLRSWREAQFSLIICLLYHKAGTTRDDHFVMVVWPHTQIADFNPLMASACFSLETVN